MDIQTITTLIGSLGFPIVCCIVMFLQLNKTSEMHKEEIDKLSEAVNNNTNVMNQLISKLD
jgi:uncharacterized membrane protein